MNYSVDEAYMRMALSISQDGLGRVWPNPSVGCVIVKDGVAAGYGRTADSGRPHAEAVAIAMAGERAKGATAYVTLEPCAVDGREGACADALIKAEVSRVVVACHDPNPVVYKQGISKLEKAGIQVDIGLYEAEAIDSHIGFFSKIEKNRPFVCLKQAVSSNGMIASAPGQRTQISGADAHEYLHLLRSTYDAIAVGVNTVLADDPMLSARVEGHEHSIVRVVFDSSLSIPLESKLVQTARNEPVWVLYKASYLLPRDAAHLQQGGRKPGQALGCREEFEDKKKQLKAAGVTLIETGACVLSALNKLAEAGITRLLVEGGAKLHHSFIEGDVFDEVQVLSSINALPDDGVKAAAFDFDALHNVEKRELGEDLLEIYRK